MERTAKAMRGAGRADPCGWAGRVRRIFPVGLGLALLLPLAGVAPGRSQSQSGLPYPSGSVTGQQGSLRTSLIDQLEQESPDPFDTIMMERRMRAMNAERQKQMVADASKLLKLARELNDEVARGNSGTLTGDQLRTIAEIEKLARNIKERMVDGVSPPAPSTIQPPILYPAH
jgi:hypothetical protein